MTKPNDTAAPPPQQHVIASPNPTVDDSKTNAADAAPAKADAARIQPAQAAKAAPMKSPTKPKPKRRRTAPRRN
jgi:hypothetical protein